MIINYNQFILENEDKEYEKLDAKAGDMSKKLTDKERARYKELSKKHFPIVIKKLPGDVYEIKTVGLGYTGPQGDVLAEYYREEILAKVKNPKGIHMDIRRNDGGQQAPAKAILDFFVDTPKDEDGNRKIPLEQQSNYWPTDEWTDEDRERGYQSKTNYLESKIEDKNKFTNIPTVVSTSDWTFSGGEFLTDTIKNFGKDNITHVGSNSGGGANRTSHTADDMASTWPDEDPNAEGLSVDEKLERSMKVFEKFYVDKEKAKECREAVMKDPSKYIKDGKINDKTVQDKMREITKDFHVAYFTREDGKIEVATPYGKSDRIVTDKDGKPFGPPYEFKGNWEGTGTGNAVPGIGITETDPDTAKNSALELLYTKTGQKDQLEKMKSNPKEFGLTKDGKDDWYKRGTLADREAGREHNYPGYAAEGKHPEMWKASQKAASKNMKNWKSILKKAESNKNIDDKSKPEPENWWEEYSDEAKAKYIKKHGEAPDVGNKVKPTNENKRNIMKKVKLFEKFLNESTMNNFKPEVLSNRDKVDMKLFKSLMPRTAKTVKDADRRIQTWKGNKMFVHYQAFTVQPNGNKPDLPTYKFHNSQYWLNDTQLGWAGRAGEKVNITLLTITDVTDPDNEKMLGELYVNTDTYLQEHNIVFNELKKIS